VPKDNQADCRDGVIRIEPILVHWKEMHQDKRGKKKQDRDLPTVLKKLIS
jgi:hypothetical protein